jgi:uncharacterized protein YebE (UPF0316 family)
MNTTVLITSLLIIVARITDVSLGTLRMVAVIQSRRAFATVLGFFEAVVYVCVVAKVLMNMGQPVYAIAYGLGYASGICLGMLIEQRLAFGKQLVFLLTAKGPELVNILRAEDYRVAEVRGHVPEGERTILCVEVARRDAQKLIRLANVVDDRCAFVVHDIRLTDFAERRAPSATQLKRRWPFLSEGLAFFKRGIS